MNKMIIAGRITADPELRYSASQMPIASFTVAVDRRAGKDGKKEADFFRCKAFSKTAEYVANRIGKGGRILVEGRVATGSYDDKDGKKVYTFELIVESLTIYDYKDKQDEPQSDFSSDKFDAEVPW